MLAEAMQSSIPILHMSTQVSRLCGRMGSLRPGPEVAVVTYAGLETPRSIDFNEKFLGLDRNRLRTSGWRSFPFGMYLSIVCIPQSLIQNRAA